MKATAKSPSYLVVSPVKDEEKHVHRTLDSMVAQTLRPVRWVIVDDGSVDQTPAILAHYAEKHDFIRILRLPRSQGRQPGTPVVRAFNAGFQFAGTIMHDFVVKLDCDLSFGPDYFQSLLARFDGDTRLGIASGVYLEQSSPGNWREILMPDYHAAGACKVVRRKCFEAIGGFVASRGWDTVDEIRAMAQGWRTQHFRELQMRHWRIEGSGIGPWRTNLMHGEVYYLTGGSLPFFLLKLAHRSLQRPYMVGAAGLLLGYLRSIVSRKPRLVTNEEVRCYRAILHHRIRTRVGVPQASRTG